MLAPIFLSAQLDKEVDKSWDYVTEDENIKVFTRLPDSASLKEIRILAEFHGNADTLLHIVNDANNYVDWVYKCDSSRPIEAPAGYALAYSAITDFPFPLSDRELVVLSKQWVDEDGRYHTHSTCAEEAIPCNNKFVRIPYYNSTWLIEQVGNKVYVDYASSVSPGGHIPDWVVNLAITSGPIKSFSKLIELVQERTIDNEFSYRK